MSTFCTPAVKAESQIITCVFQGTLRKTTHTKAMAYLYEDQHKNSSHCYTNRITTQAVILRWCESKGRTFFPLKTS